MSAVVGASSDDVSRCGHRGRRHGTNFRLSPPTRSTRNAKIAVVSLVVIGLVIAQRLGLFAQLSDPTHMAKVLVDLGPWGYAAFVLSYAALQPFGVPGTVFVVAAPLIWPWPIAYALSMTGTMAASVVGFSFARFVARDWISPRIPARFQKYNDALASRALSTVFLLRLIFWMPPLLHAFFGVSKVRFQTHFFGSLMGYTIPLFLLSFFGQKLFDALSTAPPTFWLATGAGVATLALASWFLQRRRGRPTP